MRLAPSVELIWQLAAGEMAAGQFSEIEPEHFCMALLKIADLPAATIAAAVKKEGAAQAIATECEPLRKRLREHGIESTRARRALRRRFSKGGVLAQGGEAHRSSASRALFESAALLASGSGCETLEPMHLLTALFESPTPAIVEAVLGKSPARPTPIAGLLEEKGRDLVKDGCDGQLRFNLAANTAAKVVLQLLGRKERKSILLVTDQDGLATDVVCAVAAVMAGDAPPTGLKERIIIDISGAFLADAHKGAQIKDVEGWSGVHEGLRRLLAEAATRPEVIIWVPGVEPNSAFGIKWSSMLREALVKGSVQFVCSVTPQVFREHLYKDAAWRRQTQAVWLDKTPENTVPREL